MGSKKMVLIFCFMKTGGVAEGGFLKIVFIGNVRLFENRQDKKIKVFTTLILIYYPNLRSNIFKVDPKKVKARPFIDIDVLCQNRGDISV